MIIFGVATIPARSKFFIEKCLPSLLKQADQVHIFVDGPYDLGLEQLKTTVYQAADYTRKIGDAGKFIGYVAMDDVEEDFYYFTADDDLIYPDTYVEDMIKWIDFFDKKAVVGLGGSHFNSFPSNTFYGEKMTLHSLRAISKVHRTIMPITCACAFHSSIFKDNPLKIEEFKIPNMSDIWLAISLQNRSIPYVVLPHSKEYLTYDHSLPIEQTIWGQQSKSDFLQTAVINEFARRGRGWTVPPLAFPQDSEFPPSLA